MLTERIDGSRTDDSSSVVVGADIGGTSTRVAIAALDGTVLSVATGGPGNPNVVGFEASAKTVRDTTQAALGQVGQVGCASRLYGLAGVTKLRGTKAAAQWLADVWPGTSAAPARLVSDFAVAFSSATDAAFGAVAITGTGAGAMLVDGGEDVARRDAWGWLLGDEGSGYWVGREALRATLAATEADRPDPLALAVRRDLGVSDDDPDPITTLLRAAYAGEPRRLAALAPLVSAAAQADQSSAAADDILARATAAVVARLLDLTAENPEVPIVSAGALATGNGPLAASVQAALTQAGRQQILQANDGLVGAVWLALTSRDAGSEPPPQWSHLFGSLGGHRS